MFLIFPVPTFWASCRHCAISLPRPVLVRGCLWSITARLLAKTRKDRSVSVSKTGGVRWGSAVMLAIPAENQVHYARQRQHLVHPPVLREVRRAEACLRRLPLHVPKNFAIKGWPIRTREWQYDSLLRPVHRDRWKLKMEYMNENQVDAFIHVHQPASVSSDG